MNNEPSSNTQLLYGTNINASDVSMKLRSFLTTFLKMDTSGADEELDYQKPPTYIEKLREIQETE